MSNPAVPSQLAGTSALDPLATTVRWRILALLIICAGLCHFNRGSISVAGNEWIMKQYSITETQMGMVYSAYLVMYTLCMVPGGWIIDRYGPRKALMLLAFGSAVFVPMTGLGSLATSGVFVLAILFVVRGLLGMANAPMHPGAARAVSFWIPYQFRTTANGLITGAAMIGSASTYYLFGFLMDRCGWPMAFVVAGGVTLVFALAWTVYATDLPRQHPSVNPHELQLIEDGDPFHIAHSESPPHQVDPAGTAAGSGPHDSPTPVAGMKPLVQNRSLALLTLSYAAVGYFEYLFIYWVQFYFDKVLQLGKEDGRMYATVLTGAMAFGMMIGGWLSDQTYALFGTRRGRAFVPVCGLLSSAVLLGLGAASHQTMWVVGCFALAMAAVGACEASFWVTGVELGGRRGGASAAILNTGGNVGGILAPVVTPLFSFYFGWQAALGLASAFCVLGAGLWWGIDPEER